MALILLTNDDGIEAKGLRVLERKLAEVAEVLVVAPDRERSAVSHGLTIQEPLNLRQVGLNRYTLNGTPADCVIHALAQVTTALPDLVISGINHGANLGDDIMYSGTVAGAREASHHGIAALAVSQAYDDSPIDFSGGVRYVCALVRRLLARKPGGAVYFNVNIPVGKIRGVRVTRQGCNMPFPHYNSFDRAAGVKSVGGGAVDHAGNDVPLDYEAIRDYCISITPLQRDQTDYVMVESLRKRGDRLFTSRRIPGLGLIGWRI